MKKFLLSLLTVLYMVTSSGFAMEIHYCMGEKAGMTWYSPQEDERCGRCGMKEKKGGCCENELAFYKISDSHKQITNDIQLGVTEVCVLPTPYSFQGIYTAQLVEPPLVKLVPPPDTGPPLRIWYAVFRL